MSVSVSANLIFEIRPTFFPLIEPLPDTIPRLAIVFPLPLKSWSVELAIPTNIFSAVVFPSERSTILLEEAILYVVSSALSPVKKLAAPV